ncbi:MAG: beta-N-acetylhexosaminidase [Candidatus Marinimicrobia bacterium]|nr:beta-N-acetylhexosaminidase [Candidatus Neomarinimicrobiota bacterium]
MNIIPKPKSTQEYKGEFLLNSTTRIIVNLKEGPLLETAEYFAERVKLATGYELWISDNTFDHKENIIFFNLDDENTKFGKEGYSLEVRPTNITIRANTSSGIFYGVQSLLQLFPVQIYGNHANAGMKWSVPSVQIEDAPKYPWRGMHLDVCRHFYPKEFIKKYIDLLALHKMNVFHWHLTEDQGWRIEIMNYPQLTEIGAWRVDRSGIIWNERKIQQPGETADYGGFYTQQDILEIVDYAAKRCILVVPEIELPGHALAALAAYPEYSCTGGPFDVATGGYWPIVDVFCPGNENTFTFLEGILDEVMTLFPGEYIHIGGDEVNKANWGKCPKCQQRIIAEGLNDENELQSYFIKRIEKFVSSKGKKLIGWDEILEGGIPPEATIMSWRGIGGGIEAAKQNHDVIMSPTDYCYFDYYQGTPSSEPDAFPDSLLLLEKVYEYNPTPPDLTPAEKAHILGGQGNVWTEYMPTSDQVEYMVLPRMSALAEAVWSSGAEKDFHEFYERLNVHCRRLDELKVNYRPTD